MPFNDAAQHEWQAWQDLCKVLKDTGAVTEEDLKASVKAHPTTPGLKILSAIRDWGDKNYTLAIENYEHDRRGEGC